MAKIFLEVGIQNIEKRLHKSDYVVGLQHRILTKQKPNPKYMAEIFLRIGFLNINDKRVWVLEKVRFY
jgi:hypothetical protein